MIGFLRGHLLEKHPDRLLVDVQGVGYDVAVPLSTFYVLPDPGESVALRVHTHVREDHIALYGFATPLEQQLFERLIGVSGIGPKLALAALSGIEPGELVRAVRAADIARLTSIPGIGRKTAERINLELKDKLPAAMDATGPAVADASPEGEARADLLSALVNLGYQRTAAEKALDQAFASLGETASFEAILKHAFKGLAR
jgi:Holliday junction DNA helicase RuvA